MKAIFYIKRFSLALPLVAFLLLPSCQDDLDVVNPNSPTLDALDTEDGLKRAMLGIYSVFGNLDYVWLALTNHEIMGDALYVPWGNFGWRWVNQPTSITLDDGTVVTPPQGGSQGEELTARNDRAQGDDNAFIHEWIDMYRINNIGNLLLEKLEEGSITLSGDAASKEATVEALARFWKGFAYSRIGSMYAAGILTDEFGGTNPNYVDRTAVIDAANSNLDLAIAALNSITDEAVYTDFVAFGIPDYMRTDGVPTTDMFIRNINTLKARNILVNNRVEDMTAAQWEQVRSLAAAGLQEGDRNLVFKTADENASFASSAWPAYRILIGWTWVSERLIQDFKEGDQRLERNFVMAAAPEVNRSGRGIQYGTRWETVSIDAGGDYASTTAGLVTIDIAGSWEEAALMEAEALIQTGSIEDGLALIDQVRTAQNAGLDAVAGTGLDQDAAYEELRSERRVGLFLRGLPFYDARRWGILDPIAEGGGREGAVVLDAMGNLNTDATFDYNYLRYWGVPDGELDFNTPADGSASVTAF